MKRKSTLLLPTHLLLAYNSFSNYLLLCFFKSVCFGTHLLIHSFLKLPQHFTLLIPFVPSSRSLPPRVALPHAADARRGPYSCGPGCAELEPARPCSPPSPRTQVRGCRGRGSRRLRRCPLTTPLAETRCQGAAAPAASAAPRKEAPRQPGEQRGRQQSRPGSQRGRGKRRAPLLGGF